MFTDDNWGNIMRLPLANETSRPGGIGVSRVPNLMSPISLIEIQMYYHLEFVGAPKSYKWQNTNNLVRLATSKAIR